MDRINSVDVNGLNSDELNNEILALQALHALNNSPPNQETIPTSASSLNRRPQKKSTERPTRQQHPAETRINIDNDDETPLYSRATYLKNKPCYFKKIHAREDLKDFDWSNDSGLGFAKMMEYSKREQEQEKKQPPFPKIVNWYKSWPVFIRTILLCLTGVIFLIIPGLISYFFYVDKSGAGLEIWEMKNRDDSQEKMMLFKKPWFVFSFYLCISWCSWFIFQYIFKVLPEVVGRLSEIIVRFFSEDYFVTKKISNYLSYLKSLSFFIAAILFNFTNLLLWEMFGYGNYFKDPDTPFQPNHTNSTDPFQPNHTNSTNPFHTNLTNSTVKAETNEEKLVDEASDVFEKILLCLLYISIAFFIEKFLLKIFAVNFHKRAFKDRLDRIKYAYKILGNLNKAKRQDREQEKSSGDEKMIDILADGARSFLGVVGAAVGVDMGPTSGILLRSLPEAKATAQRIFEALVDEGSEFVTFKNFKPYFETELQATIAFSFFDRNGNGNIAKTEMKRSVVNIFLENEDVECSITQSSQSIAKLDELFKVVMWIGITIIVMKIFDPFSTVSFMTALAGIWLGVAFAVGGTITNLVESIIFLFITHPFDVGDNVTIDNENFTIKEFHLMTTTMVKEDGNEVYAPNSSLSSKMIYNIRRSGPQSEKIHLMVGIDTPQSKILHLHSILTTYLTEHESRDIIPELHICLEKIVDGKSMKLSMQLQHRRNFQDLEQVRARNDRFLWKLKDAINKVGIELVD